MITKSSKPQPEIKLLCPDCGNANRFIEVMAEEAHIVNGRGDYIRLLEAFVDHYVCCDCSATIELDTVQVAPGKTRSENR